MPTFTGKFEYLIDGKKVTQEQFQQLVDGKENDYDISIDNLRVVADKKRNEPFFLDEFLFPAKNKIKFTSLVIPHKSAENKVKTEELRGYLVENQRFNNLDTIVKIMQADNEEELKSAVKEDWTANNTGGAVFEKVQDSTLPPHPTKEQINKAFSEDIKRNVKILTGEGDKKYSLKLDCKLPDSYIKSFNSAQEKFVENLDVYNDIVGHSTRHKAGKEIKTEEKPKFRANFYNYTYGSLITQVKDFITLEEIEEYFNCSIYSEVFIYEYGTQELVDKWDKAGELETLKKQLLNSGIFISLEDATLIFNAETEEELQPLLDRIEVNENVLLGESPVFNLKESAEYINRNFGKKETEGKLDYSEINFELLDLMAKRFMDNKSKYPKGNTLKKINKEDLVFAAFRHLRKMIKPIKDDPETFKDHLVAVSTNMSILLDQLNLEENE